jgi:endonuclease I
MKFIKSLICNYLCINNLHKLSKTGVDAFKKNNINPENNYPKKFCNFKKTKIHYLENNIYYDIYKDSLITINKQIENNEVQFDNLDYNKYNDLTAEHIFPQSFLREYSFAKFDMHNIYLTKDYINSNRSNYKYIDNNSIEFNILEEEKKEKKEKKEKTKYFYNKIKSKFKNNNKILKKIIVKREKQYNKKNKNNKNKFIKIHNSQNYKNNKLKLFIPHEESRGAIARSLAYMKYTYPNIELDKVINRSTLIEWNRDYPPTNIERIQNEVIKNIQGNYNIFILNYDLVNTLNK